MIKLFISLIFLSLLISCNQKIEERLSKPLVLKDGLLYADTLSAKPFTGRNKSRMLDMKIEYDVVDGKKEGDFIIYFPNDKIQMIGYMKQNKNVGEWKYYFSNGTLQTTGSYDNDVATGKWTWYYESGKILEEGQYVNGKREGEWKNYDTLGVVELVRVYKSDLMIDSTRVK